MEKRHTEMLQWYGMAARREWQILKNDTACIKVWDPQLYKELCLSLETTALLSGKEEMKGNAARNSLTLQGKKTLNKNNKPNQPTTHKKNEPQRYDLDMYFWERYIYLPPLI